MGRNIRLGHPEGGDHDEDRLIVLCSAHHRATHVGRLIIEGRGSTGLVFRHADGTSYGRIPSAENQEVHAKLFAGLRGMGFGERETKQALKQVREQLPGEVDARVLLRKALEILTPDRLRAH